MSRKNKYIETEKDVRVGIPKINFKPVTKNQYNFCRSIGENIITITSSLSGVGKTYCTLGMACQYLLDGKIDKILLSKSIVSCEDNIGTLPGSLEERTKVYFLPYLEYLDLFLSRKVTEELIKEEKIQLLPCELIRGHTYNKTFMILDEVQNCTIPQLKVFLTRIGKDSKVVLLGDKKQKDIKGYTALDFCIDKFDNVPDIQICEFGPHDICRNGILKNIIPIFEDSGY